MAWKKYHYLKIKKVLIWGLLLGAAGPLFLFPNISTFAANNKIHLHRIDVTRLPDVHVFFTVINTQGECVLGLSEKEMELYIDQNAQVITSVESALAGQEYMAVALLFDRSGSVKSGLDQAKTAALDFVKRLNLNDKIAVISFDDRVRMDADFSRSRSEVESAISSIQTGRDTALFDAVDTALDLLQKETYQRQALVVLSDGRDTKSLNTQPEIKARAKKEGVPIFTIGIGKNQDREDLKDISLGTGGIFLEAGEPEDLMRLYQTIGDQLQNQYHLTFTSSMGIDEQWHNLKILVKEPGEQAAGTLPLVAAAEREYIATKGMGITRKTVSESLQKIKRENMVLILAIGALLGLVLGMVVLLILKLARPEQHLRPGLCMGLLISTTCLGTIVGTMIYFLK